MTENKGVGVIYTGGTLGMVRSAGSYVPAPDLERLLTAKMPELRAEGMPPYEVIDHGAPIDSANVTPRFWYELAAEVAALEDRYDGFVIVHGTDTLAYSASALSFLLAGMAKPVVLTGAQIPLAEIRNDAHANLLAAILVASLGRSAKVSTEVSIVFGSRLLRANRTTKIRSTALDAFDSPSAPPLAHLGTEIRFQDGKDPAFAHPATWFERPAYQPKKVALLPVFPGISADVVTALVATGCEGLVLECYGLGTAPVGDADLLAALCKAIAAGVVVVAISQCLEGSVRLRTYAAGAALADCGVISGFDMTREAAFTKLHYLLARGLPPKEVAKHMQQNLCGELTPERASDKGSL